MARIDRKALRKLITGGTDEMPLARAIHKFTKKEMVDWLWPKMKWFGYPEKELKELRRLDKRTLEEFVFNEILEPR